MSATQAAVRTFEVAGFRAEISFPCLVPGTVASAVVEWSPRVPRFDVDFSPADRTRYQRLLMEAIKGAAEEPFEILMNEVQK